MLLLLVKDSDYYVALGDNVLDAMTDTYQAGLQGAVEAPYYQGDYDAAALAFFRQADVFYAQTLGRQQSGGSYSDYEDNGAWQGNDSGSVAAVVLLVVGIFVVWILLDGLRYRRYRRRPVVVGGPVYYPVFWDGIPVRPAACAAPWPPSAHGRRSSASYGGRPQTADGRRSSARQSSSQYPSTLPAFRFPALRSFGGGSRSGGFSGKGFGGSSRSGGGSRGGGFSGKGFGRRQEISLKKIAGGTKFLPLFFSWL